MSLNETRKHFLYKIIIGENKEKTSGLYLYVYANSVYEAVDIVQRKRPNFAEAFKRIEEVRNWCEKEQIFLTEVIL